MAWSVGCGPVAGLRHPFLPQCLKDLGDPQRNGCPQPEQDYFAARLCAIWRDMIVVSSYAVCEAATAVISAWS